MALPLLYFHRNATHFFIFFFNDTATTEIYTLSLHDALPISTALSGARSGEAVHCHMDSSGALAGFSSIPPSWLKRSEEHTSELQSHLNLVCRLLLEKKKLNTRRPKLGAMLLVGSVRLK